MRLFHNLIIEMMKSIISMRLLPFEIAPEKIISKKGVKRGIIKSSGQSNQKLTGLFLIRADRIKCKQLIIFKGAYKRRIAKEVKSYINDEILCCTQSNTWNDSHV